MTTFFDYAQQRKDDIIMDLSITAFDRFDLRELVIPSFVVIGQQIKKEKQREKWREWVGGAYDDKIPQPE